MVLNILQKHWNFDLSLVWYKVFSLYYNIKSINLEASLKCFTFTMYLDTIIVTIDKFRCLDNYLTDSHVEKQIIKVLNWKLNF